MPAFVVLSVAFVGLAAVTVRASRAARRWLADPPGPPREMPAPLPSQRWIRSCAVLGAAFLLLGFVVGLVAGLT